MNTSPIICKPLNINNIADAYILYKNWMNPHAIKEKFIQKYTAQIFPLTECSYIAYSENKPVGFLGVIPYYIQHGSKQGIVAQRCDAIVIPAFRSRGIYRQLTKLVSDSIFLKDIDFVFSVFNQIAYRATQKMGFNICNKHFFYYRIPLRRKTYLHKLTNNIYKPDILRSFDDAFSDYIVENLNIANPLNEIGLSVIQDNHFHNYKRDPNHRFLKIGILSYGSR